MYEVNQEKTGKLIASKRKEKGLTQEQLAEKLGVTNKAVSKWETGRGMPDLAIIQKLCEILGITVTTLLNGEENEEALILKLLWINEQLKQLYLVIIGLVICYVPQVLENVTFIKETMNGTDFLSGMLNGSFAVIKLVGVIVFAYGLACYGNKKNKRIRMNKTDS